MAILDKPLRSVAKTLSDKFGKVGTIEYAATGAYDPSTGEATQQRTSLVTRGELRSYTTREIDGTTVKRGDLLWSIAAKGVPRPFVNDLVDFDEETSDGRRIRYTVMSVRVVYAGDDPALYELQLRR